MIAADDASAGLRQPLHLLIDANAFGRRSWIESLIDSSQAGHVRLYWSPTIVEGMARFRPLLWMRNWLKSGGTRLTDAVARRFSVEAHRWMDFVSPHFHVVEDKPPHAPAWVEPLPDPYDAPIWTAARRARVDMIVTMNLKDGPPEDAHGNRTHDGVLYLSPTVLAPLLDWWGNQFQTGVSTAALSPTDAGVDEDTLPLSLSIRTFLLGVVRSRGAEQSDSGDGDKDDGGR